MNSSAACSPPSVDLPALQKATHSKVPARIFIGVESIQAPPHFRHWDPVQFCQWATGCLLLVEAV